MGWIEACGEAFRSANPFSGSASRLQVIFEGSEESPGVEGLGLLPGKVVRFGGDGLKVPHMGWNELSVVRDHPVLDGLDGEAFYFVHSYYPEPDEDDLIGETDYGARFCAAAGRENLVAVQFHPEKSSRAGLKLYENFLAGRDGSEWFHRLSRHRPARRQMRASQTGGFRTGQGV